MPGITGLITTKPSARAEEELTLMLGALYREPFYEMGRFTDAGLGLYLGWTARQGSFSTGMPLRNESGSKILFFSGNDFTDASRIDVLRTKGHNLGIAENGYLVHLAEEEPNFPESLNGPFHGLLIDRESRDILLFNDRFGLQRLYFHQTEECLYFSAEAKAILAVCPRTRQLDWEGMSQFAACGYPLGNRSLFQGIEILPPASAWRFAAGRSRSRDKYFSPERWEEQSPLEPEPYYNALRDCFARILPRYFKGSQPIGLSLTGGLDTRAILAWRRPEPGSLPCYTFGGGRRESRDVHIAGQVARQCGQSFQPLSVGNKFLADFASYSARTVFLSDGCCPVNLAPDLYLNGLARQIAPVRLTGVYGDEMLRHLSVLKFAPPTPLAFAPAFYRLIEAAEPELLRLSMGHPLTVAAFRQLPYAFFGMRFLEESQLEMRTPFLDIDLLQLLYRAPQSALKNNDLRTRLVAEGWPALRAIRTDLGFLGRGGRLGEAFSSRLHRFTMRCEWAFDIGMPQWLAQVTQWIEPLQVERLFLGRHKFTHFRIWYQRELAPLLREILLDPRSLSRPYIHSGGLRQAVEGHLSGRRNETVALNKILTLELVQRLLLEGKSWPSHASID